jgi:hypothetical protein
MKRMFCVLVALALLLPVVACEPPDDATIAKVITSATSVAFTQILAKNPKLEEGFYMYATLSKKAVVDHEVDAELAKAIFSDILEQCKDLDKDAKTQLVALFSTILPLIEIPEEGYLNERTEKFFIAFLDGIINTIETRRALAEPEPDPVRMWDAKPWLFKETLNGLV